MEKLLFFRRRRKEGTESVPELQRMHAQVASAGIPRAKAFPSIEFSAPNPAIKKGGGAKQHRKEGKGGESEEEA